MALRMHPVSASRWAKLAAARHPVDVVESPRPRADNRRKRRAEHAAIQAQVAAIAARRVEAFG
jgi:hypothetical protein